MNQLYAFNLKPPLTKSPVLQVVVFFSTCDAVDFHYSLLNEFQLPTVLQSEKEVKQKFLKCKTLRLHGSMDHNDRKTAFQAFKTDKSALLLSTDVSARGLDFPKVRCIIQYDSPGEATEYVHRYIIFHLLLKSLIWLCLQLSFVLKFFIHLSHHICLIFIPIQASINNDLAVQDIIPPDWG